MVSRSSAKPKLESGTTLELAQTRLLAPAGFDASAFEGLLSGLMKPGIRPPPSLIRGQSGRVAVRSNGETSPRRLAAGRWCWGRAESVSRWPVRCARWSTTARFPIAAAR